MASTLSLADPATDLAAARAAFARRMGDDCLILGQRLGEWCGHAPTIEVDLSLANLGLDLIGQATLWLDLAGELEGAGRSADALAFHRDEIDFTNCLLVEQPNGDFAQTMARQWLFSTWQHALLLRLAQSADLAFAGIAAKGAKESRYHAELARHWVVRLGDGTEESRRRMIAGLDWMWRFVAELFEEDALSDRLAAAAVAPRPMDLRADFDQAIAATLAEAMLPTPATPRPVLGGRRGRHSEHLGHLLAVMQHLPRSHPGATW